jgi:menaquinone-dependent protoporphyrinogen oxidase
MSRALIVHASRHGGSAGIAERIGEVLEGAGVEVVVAKARDLPDPEAFDACIVGAGVYMGSWVEDGVRYLERYAPVLATKPTWLFSSGPLPGSTKEPKDPSADPVEVALGPAEGPGSGGRRKLEAALGPVHPKEHKVFSGAFDPTDPPATLSERVVRMMPAAKGILPAGDFREWPAIEAWAKEIAATLAEPVPVG